LQLLWAVQVPEGLFFASQAANELRTVCAVLFFEHRKQLKAQASVADMSDEILRKGGACYQC